MKRLLITTTMLVSLGMASASAAPIVTITGIEMPKYETLTVHVIGGYNGGALVGQFILTTTTMGTFPGWCIDVWHDTVLGAQTGKTFDLGAITTDSNGHVLTASQIQQIGGLINYGNAHSSTNAESAATQLAIWKIEYGNTFSWDGNPSLDAQVAALISLAPTLTGDGFALSALNGQQTLACGLTDCGGSGGGSSSTVPEPASLGIIGLALAGLRWVKRRKKAA